VGKMPEKMKKNIAVITEAIQVNWEDISQKIAHEFNVDGLLMVDMPPMPEYDHVYKCICVGHAVCHKLWHATLGSDRMETCEIALNWMNTKLKKAKNQVEFDRLIKEYMDEEIRK
jgi:hypothetical protein